MTLRSAVAVPWLAAFVLSLVPRLWAADDGAAAGLRAEMKLSAIPYKIVYESFRESSFDLCMMNADGTQQVNLTNTPDVDEMYPHVSPDGTRICCLVDDVTAGEKTRNLYLMNLDGTGRTKIADNAREGCWSADGKRVAYLKAEFTKFTLVDYASKGLVIYDVATRTHTPHPNPNLHHLYNLSWTPDGSWFVTTVHGGMGYRHAILAFEANGTKVFDLGRYGVGGCRPDLSADGRLLAWGANDETLKAGDFDVGGTEPKVTQTRTLAGCDKGSKTYHVDWAPDGQHVAFSFGPEAGKEMIGEHAPGWNICVADLTGKWVPITSDGRDNKEPDWVPLPAGAQ
jgi:Tol biopolymer transport system component